MSYTRPCDKHTSFRVEIPPNRLKPHCIRCSHFKVYDVGALEASSKPPICIVEDNITYAMTLDAVTM
jgi:hypothetical protein